MNMEINNLAKQVRGFFINCQLEECIESANQIKSEVDGIRSYQFAQIYKGLSLFEQSQRQLGQQCFKELIDYCKKSKLTNIDEIDIIMITLYQWQNFDESNRNAKLFNEQLLKSCNEYKSQNEKSQHFKESIFIFGTSMYNFIQSYEIQLELQWVEQLITQIQNEIIELKEEFLFIIGWIYDYLEQEEQALKYYKTLEEINPNFPGLANNLGLLYGALHQNKKSEEYYLKAIQICPKNAINFNNLALEYQRIHQNEKAIYYFKKSIEINPQLGNSYSHYSRFLIQNNKHQDGLDILFTGLQQDPTNVSILIQLIYLEANKNNFEKSEEYLNKLIKSDPNNGLFEYKYGNYFFERDQFSRSLQYLLSSLNKDLNPLQQGITNSKLGFIYYQLGQYTKALNQYFYTCNLQIKQYHFYQDLEEISVILDETDEIPMLEKINIINSQFGLIQTRLDIIIQLTNNKIIKKELQNKQDQFLNVLSHIVYSKNIQPYLTYKQEFNHWDLFLD